jgi:acyl-homoserine-lactone acylase
MTIFSLYHERRMRDEKLEVLAALDEVLNSLERDFGTWKVAWGDINRLQRIDESRDQDFDDSRPSLAVSGVNGNDGAVFTVLRYARARTKTAIRRRRVEPYISVVEFGPQVRAPVCPHVRRQRRSEE